MKVFILSCLALSLSVSAQTDFNQKREAEAITMLKNTVKSLSTSYLSCQTAAACALLDIGSKPCGGPSEFVIFSKNNRNFYEMSFLAGRTNSREHAYNIKYNIRSSCEVQM